MRILITGSLGQLGSELKLMLKNGTSELGEIPKPYQGAAVVALDRRELDICDAEAVGSFFSKNEFDLIINCAAMTDVDGCEKDKQAAFLVNEQGCANLAIQAERQSAKYVYVSTDYVFSGFEATPHTEDDACAPQNIYGASKLAGERQALGACSRCFVIRTAWLYGYEGKNFVKTMLHLAKTKGTIKVVDDQRGNPTNANDLAHEILEIAATENYGLYHATNNGVCSWFEFACAAVDFAAIPCAKVPCDSTEFASLVKRPLYSSLDNKHLRDTIGDKMRPWDVALRSYIDKLNEVR